MQFRWLPHDYIALLRELSCFDRRVVIRIAVLLALAAACAACATHNSQTCDVSARLFGDGAAPASAGGWIVVKPENSVDETAKRIATTYHVRTEPIRDAHAFSISPIPESLINQLRCDPSILEIHYASPTSTTSGP